MKYKYLYLGTKNYRVFLYSILLVFTLLFAASFLNLGSLGGLNAADWTSVRSSTAPSTFSDGYVKITSANELAFVAYNISSYKTKNIRLASNIDLAGYTWTPIGAGSNGYSGTFDGAGYVIFNMKVSTTRYAGLFGYTSSATIKNVVINKATVNGSFYVGGVVGYQYNGTIENCDVQNSTIMATYSSDLNIYAGGIVGYSSYGIVKNCRGYSNTIKTMQGYGNISANVYNYAGGIAGAKSGGSLYNCANTNGGIVSTYGGYQKYAYTGGIVGLTSVAINTSYNEAAVNGGDASYSQSSYTGGIAGYSSSTIADCFNKGNVSGYAATVTISETTTFNPFTGEVQFANNVGALWAYDLYIVSGRYTDNGGTGPYKNDDRSSSKSRSGRRAYTGGIVGYITSTINRVYNLGKIGGSDSTFTQHYSLNFKWKANRQYYMRFNSSISYGYQYNSGNIVGYTSSTVSNAYFKNDTKLSKSFSFSASQHYYGKSTTKSNMTLTSWTKNKGTGKTDTPWYLNTMDGGEYYTYHNIDASSVSKIVFSARYQNTDEKQKETTYYTINTGLSSAKYTEKGTAVSLISLSNLNGNSKFAINSNINGGYPYLKDMYW